MAASDINAHRAHSVIARLGDVSDSNIPIGRRLNLLRSIIDEAQKAERQLLMQVGVNLAKDLAEKGIRPTNRPLGETLKAMEAQCGD